MITVSGQPWIYGDMGVIHGDSAKRIYGEAAGAQVKELHKEGVTVVFLTELQGHAI